MADRPVWDRDYAGSIPATPTNFVKCGLRDTPPGAVLVYPSNHSGTPKKG